MNSISKIKKISSGIFIICLLIFFSNHTKDTFSKPNVTLPLVTVTSAQAGTLPVSIEIPSVAESQQMVKIFPRVEGELLKIHFKEGDIVQPEQILFTLDSDLNQQQLLSLQAQLANHQARFAYYQKEQIRYKQLSMKDYAPKEQYDLGIMNSLTEAATIEDVKAQIKQIELKIHYSTIRSPLRGKIGFVNVYEGTYVKTNDVMALTTIMKLDPLRFCVYLPEKYIKFIQNNQAIYSIKDQNGNCIADSVLRKARLDAVDNAIDASMGNICFKIAVDNSDDQLIPGLYTTIQIIFEHKQGMKIPLNCLQRGQKGDYIYKYVAKNQNVSTVFITIGAMDDQSIIVTQGLQEGDQVVVQGQVRLRDGCQVRAQAYQP